MARKRLTWKKLGGGSFHTVINGAERIIKPGEMFEAFPYEIPDAHRDVVACIDKKALKESEEEATEIVSKVETIFVVRAVSRGWYNVFNVASDKAMNDSNIRKGKADELAATLNA